jgi:hypothetical protein
MPEEIVQFDGPNPSSSGELLRQHGFARPTPTEDDNPVHLLSLYLITLQRIRTKVAGREAS